MSDAKCRARPPGQEKATVSRGPDTLRAFSTGARPREVGSTASRLRSPTAPGSLTGWARRPGSPTARRSHGPALPRPGAQSCWLRAKAFAAAVTSESTGRLPRESTASETPNQGWGPRLLVAKALSRTTGVVFHCKDNANGAKRKRAAPPAHVPEAFSQEEAGEDEARRAREGTHQWPCGSSPSALPSS